MPKPRPLETLLNNAFLTLPMTAEEEFIVAAYEQSCVMLDHAEDLEDFDFFSIRKEVGEVRPCK